MSNKKYLLCLIMSCLIFGQNKLDRKISIIFDKETIRESLSNLLIKCKVNFIISNNFEQNRFVDLEYKNKTLRSILNDFSNRFLFDYHYDKTENFLAINYKPHTVQGYFLDLNGHAVSNAIVHSEVLNKSVITNDNGFFFFKNVNKKSIDLSVHHIQYSSFNTKILKSEYQKHHYFYLKERIYNQSEESIYAIGNIQYSPLKNEIIFKENLRKSQMRNSSKLLDAVTLIPGFYGKSEVIYNSSSQFFYFFDDIPIYHADHLNGFYSIFNPKTLNKINLHRGVYSSKYTGHISGLLEISSKQAGFDKNSFSAGFNTISYYGHLELALSEKISLFLSARKAMNSIINSKLYERLRNFKENENTENPQSEENIPSKRFEDLIVKVNALPTTNSHLEFTYISSYDNTITSSFSNYEAAYQNVYSNTDFDRTVLNKGYNLRYSINWAPRFSSVLSATKSLYDNSDNYKMVYNYADEYNQQYTYKYSGYNENTIDENIYKLEIDYQLMNNLSLKSGLQHRLFRLADKFYINNQNEAFSNQKLEQQSFYLQSFYKISSFLKFDMGINQTLSGKIKSLEPRFAMIVEPKKSFSVKALYGVFNQILHKIRVSDFNRLRKETWLLSDNDIIPVSRSKKFQLSASYNKEYFKINADIYFNKYTNIINFHHFLPIHFPDLYYSEGNSRGFEIFSEYLLNRKELYLWLKYSYKNSDMPISFLSFRQNYVKIDQSLNILLNYDPSDSWSYSLNFNLETGNSYQEELSNINGIYNYMNNNKKINIMELPNTHRLDVKISKSFIENNYKWNLSLSILNLYNQKNILRKEVNRYVIDYTEKKQTHNIYMYGITPIFSLELEL